jgi:hypothetical protein
VVTEFLDKTSHGWCDKTHLGIGYLKRTSLSPGAWAFLRHLDKLDNILPIAQ